MDCRNCNNDRCYLNVNCRPSWLEYVQTFKTRKLISAGMKVFSQGELVTGIYVICSGKLKILMKTGSGKNSIIRLAADGQVLGHRGISEKMVYPISAETLEDSELAFLPTELFFKLLRNNVDLSFYMMMFFADELLRSEQKFRLRSLDSSLLKVASALVLVIDAFGFEGETNTIDLPMTFTELANFAEVSKHTFLKSCTRLAEQQIIEFEDNRINVPNEPALRRLAEKESVDETKQN